MPTLEFREAIRQGLDECLRDDERVIFFGEDVAIAGGVFAANASACWMTGGAFCGSGTSASP